MKTYLSGLMTGALAVSLLALTAWHGRADAQRGASSIVGAGDAGMREELLTWRTLEGRAQKLNVQRLVLKVPEYYGVLTTVTGGDNSSLWFVDKKGVLRNVFIGNQVVAVEPESNLKANREQGKP
jgi:hypothetical protein